MRRFSAEYLEATRRGMWEERAALAPLELGTRDRILDVGCGTGELTAVLREESGARVVGLDADPSLLAHADGERLVGDATTLPVVDGAFDLVVCQALLVNLGSPAGAVSEFARVSSDLVAAIEPDNGAVEVDSTVEPEPRLSRLAREAYIEGVGTDVTLGSDTDAVFREAGLSAVSTRRYVHCQRIEPPYTDAAIRGAAAKASGARLADQRATMLAGDLTVAEYDALREDWRAMGREVVSQIESGTYVRVERVPFYVTVGRN